MNNEPFDAVSIDEDFGCSFVVFPMPLNDSSMCAWYRSFINQQAVSPSTRVIRVTLTIPYEVMPRSWFQVTLSTNRGGGISTSLFRSRRYGDSGSVRSAAMLFPAANKELCPSKQSLINPTPSAGARAATP